MARIEENIKVRDDLTLPVVMLVEGVLNGSDGPILHKSNNFKQYVRYWNAIPVTADHPQSNGKFVSVNSVDPDHYIIGVLKDVEYDNGKLRGTIHLDEQRTIAIDPEIIQRIENGYQTDVSIGSYTNINDKQGVYNNKRYIGIVEKYTPDHLAIVHHGACSFSMGCGIRNNSQNDNDLNIINMIQTNCNNSGCNCNKNNEQDIVLPMDAKFTDKGHTQEIGGRNDSFSELEARSAAMQDVHQDFMEDLINPTDEQDVLLPFDFNE